MNRHALVLLYFFPPVGTAGASIRTIKFMKYLTELGWRFTVVAAHPDRQVIFDPGTTSKYLEDEIPPDTKILRVPARLRIPSKKRLTNNEGHGDGQPTAQKKTATGSSALKNSLRGVARWVPWRDLLVPDPVILWIREAYKALMESNHHEKFDVIYAAAPPFSILRLATNLKRKLHVPLVLDIKDDWTGSPFLLEKPKIIQRIHESLERRIFFEADRVLVVTKPSYRHYTSLYEDFSDKFEYIPNGCDLADFEPHESAVSRQPNDKFTIISAGGYYRDSRNPEPLFRALGELIRQNRIDESKVEILLIGDSLHKDFSNEDLASFGVDKIVRQVAPLPKSAYIEQLRQADLLLSILYEGGYATMVPGKLYEYWAAGWPPVLMLDDGGAARELLEEYELGNAVDRRDVAGIVRALDGYYNAWRDGSPKTIPLENIEKFDRKNLASGLHDIFLDVLNDRGEL